MMRKLFPHPAESLLLLFVWLLLVDSFAVGQWLLGGFLGWVIPFCFKSLLIERPGHWHPLKLMRFLLMVVWDVLVANFQVARLTLGRVEALRPAFVEVPIDLDNELAISVLVSVVSLTPGSLAADLSADRRTLLVHGLDVPDKAAMVAEIKSRYEAPLKEIFPCSPT
ncbi:Na(+)/H(+) antiporter subunit E1 [compost metagenome]